MPAIRAEGRARGRKANDEDRARGPQPPDPPFLQYLSSGAGPGAGGLEYGCGSNPCPSCSLHFVMADQSSKNTYQTNHRPTPRPGGRRTSPACGSCRRPQKIYENQGIENQTEKITRLPYDKSEKIRKGGESEKDEARTARGTRERKRTNINISNEREAETIARRHKRHHFPPYSRAEEQIYDKSMIFEAPEPARMRCAPSKTHTF